MALRVRSREEGRAMIYQAAESVLPTDIVLKRNSKEISVNLDPGAKGQGYPFAAPGYNSSKLSFGVFMNQGRARTKHSGRSCLWHAARAAPPFADYI